MQNLRGKPKIFNEAGLYEGLDFVEGRCLNCMQELAYEDLVGNFISEDIKYYRLFRTNLVSAKAKLKSPLNQSSKSINLE